MHGMDAMPRNVTILDPSGAEILLALLERLVLDDVDLLDGLEPWKAGVLGDDLVLYDGLAEPDREFTLKPADFRGVSALLLALPPQARAAALAAGFRLDQVLTPPWELDALAHRIEAARRQAPVPAVAEGATVLRFARA